MRRYLPAIITTLTFAGMYFNFPVLVHAQSATPTTPQVVTVQTTDLTGRVIKIQDNKLTIDFKDSTKEVTIPGNVRITRNGMVGPLKDIQVGDQVTVTLDNASNVLKIDSQAVSVLEAYNMLIIIIPVLLLLAFLVYLYNRSRNQAHIKTAPAQVS